MSLVALSVSHRTAPLAMLERLALSGGDAARLLGELTRPAALLEAVALCTCNRTELYLAAADADAGERIALDALARSSDVHPATLRASMRSLRGPGAARHLFRVTAGLESLAVGETEVQGQVKRAYERAQCAATTGPVTDHLFRSALDAGRRVRRETGAANPRLSVAAVAVRLAARRLGGLAGAQALVIGTGESAELVGRRLAEREARTVFVAGRRFERGLALARRFGGRAIPLEALGAQLPGVAAVFGCASSPRQIVGRDQAVAAAARRRQCPLLLIDMAVPRNIEPAVAGVAGTELYDMDDLKREVARDTDRAGALGAEAAPLIEEEVERFQAWLASLDVLPAIAALRARGDAAAKQVLREGERDWQSLSARDRERVDVIARAIVSRLLHEPTMRLRRAAGTEDCGLYARAVEELFGSAPAPAADARATGARAT